MAKSKTNKKALDELIESVSAKEDLLVPLSEKDRKKKNKKEKPEPVAIEKLSEEKVESPQVTYPENESIEHMADLIRHLSRVLDRSHFAEYVALQNRPFKFILRNFWAGFFKGLGFLIALLLIAVGGSYLGHQVFGIDFFQWFQIKIAELFILFTV